MANGIHTSPRPASAGFPARVDDYRRRVNDELERWLTPDTVASETLLGAMQYALLGGGKRIRPLLAYASGELLGVAPEHGIDAIATAIEMIHAYSLVHDDLPAMDDDELRRGRPTVHVAYDEATAILVGDALQALAFQVLTEHPAVAAQPAASAGLVHSLAKAAGADGMVGGQALDLAYSESEVTQRSVEDMFARKTGRLIGAAIAMPLECADSVPPDRREALLRLADTAGLCFQIRDDILDVTASTEQIGKPSGSDARNNRSSYPARFGLESASRRAESLLDEATRCLDRLGPRAEGLRWLTDYIARRDR